MLTVFLYGCLVSNQGYHNLCIQNNLHEDATTYAESTADNNEISK